jgi:hypothetical protein
MHCDVGSRFLGVDGILLLHKIFNRLELHPNRRCSDSYGLSGLLHDKDEARRSDLIRGSLELLKNETRTQEQVKLKRVSEHLLKLGGLRLLTTQKRKVKLDGCLHEMR